VTAYAGVELGGTKCVAILARGPEDIVARETVPTTSPDETLARIEQMLSRWRSEQGFAALGIGSFGPLELDADSPEYGRITNTPKPGWRGTDVLGPLQRAAGVCAAFDTDVNGAALAEMRWGAGQGFDDFAYVTVGTGVGVGLIVNGKPTRGFAHCELGHIRVARLAGDSRRALRCRRAPAIPRSSSRLTIQCGSRSPGRSLSCAMRSSAPQRPAQSPSAAEWSRTSRICSTGSSAC
jgi:fructokinase